MMENISVSEYIAQKVDGYDKTILFDLLLQDTFNEHGIPYVEKKEGKFFVFTQNKLSELSDKELKLLNTTIEMYNQKMPENTKKGIFCKEGSNQCTEQ